MEGRNKKLLLSLLVLVLLVSIGKETYALFTNEVSSIVQSYGTGTLKLSYSNTSINLDNAYPMTDTDGMSQSDSTITITNIGTLAYKFNVILDPSSNSTISSDLIRVSMDGENPATLSTDSNIIIRDVILNPGSSRTFTIKLWINSNTSSSDILNKKFSASLTSTGIAVKNMADSNGTVLIGNYTGPLYDYIKNNADTTTTIDFSKTSEASSTNGIYMTTDTEGNVPVYYYRGNVDNHVLFANYCWRIVRTTETGGVKLIYDGVPSNGQCNNTGDNSTIGSSAFNTNKNDNAYVGYMFGTAGSSTYASTHANTNDSTMKGVIDTWYHDNMTSYTSQLEDTIWCNDRSIVTDLANSNGGYYSSYTTLGYGTNKTLYGPTSRVGYKVSNPTPTLKCAQDNDKFTVNASNGNGALTYPVGLITADEMAYAGVGYGSSNANSSFYLYTGQAYWTLSPRAFGGAAAVEFYLGSDGSFGTNFVAGGVGLRPSVSLQPGIEVTGGSGTATDPFVIAKPSLYDYIKSNADTTTTIDFSKTSEASSTNGIYMTTDTEGNVPVYYYRGNVDNHVLFANFCWRIVRTTETGGVKLIYDGKPTNGQCNNTGANTTIGNIQFNTNYNSPAYVGYMYNIAHTADSKDITKLSGNIVFGNDATYDTSTGKYTLKDTKTLTNPSNWGTEYSNYTDRYHYTCFSSGTTCQSVYYIHIIYSENKNAYYFTLTNGKKPKDLLNDMFEGNINVKESNAKVKLDAWYKTNMTSYTSKLEDSGFCNDRTYYNFSSSGWNNNYSNYDKWLYFSSVQRLSNRKLSLVCPRQLDKFSVSTNNGNGKLTYPVGMITAEEIAYAGGVIWQTNTSYYLYNGVHSWSLSPSIFRIWGASEFSLYSSGDFSDYGVAVSLGGRPVVSLKPGIALTSGSGTSADPFVIG